MMDDVNRNSYVRIGIDDSVETLLSRWIDLEFGERKHEICANMRSDIDCASLHVNVSVLASCSCPTYYDNSS
jgi:hypothetical protein